jgi:hypothetical protein
LAECKWIFLLYEWEYNGYNLQCGGSTTEIISHKENEMIFQVYPNPVTRQQLKIIYLLPQTKKVNLIFLILMEEKFIL